MLLHSNDLISLQRKSYCFRYLKWKLVKIWLNLRNYTPTGKRGHTAVTMSVCCPFVYKQFGPDLSQLLLGRILSYLIHSFDLMSWRFSYIFISVGTLFGLKDLFGLCRCSVYTGSKCIETDMNGLQKMFGLDRFLVCSWFGLYRFHCMYFSFRSFPNFL